MLQTTTPGSAPTFEKKENYFDVEYCEDNKEMSNNSQTDLHTDTMATALSHQTLT